MKLSRHPNNRFSKGGETGERDCGGTISGDATMRVNFSSNLSPWDLRVRPGFLSALGGSHGNVSAGWIPVGDQTSADEATRGAASPGTQEALDGGVARFGRRQSLLPCPSVREPRGAGVTWSDELRPADGGEAEEGEDCAAGRALASDEAWAPPKQHQASVICGPRWDPEARPIAHSRRAASCRAAPRGRLGRVAPSLPRPGSQSAGGWRLAAGGDGVCADGYESGSRARIREVQERGMPAGLSNEAAPCRIPGESQRGRIPEGYTNGRRRNGGEGDL
ncbi:hypothetical protein JHW43_007807 [Diplocarpon mali]|nr:hypothetical protein JHW43_007807 [Diplocarpon mali]